MLPLSYKVAPKPHKLDAVKHNVGSHYFQLIHLLVRVRLGPPVVYLEFFTQFAVALVLVLLVRLLLRLLPLGHYGEPNCGDALPLGRHLGSCGVRVGALDWILRSLTVLPVGPVAAVRVCRHVAVAMGLALAVLIVLTSACWSRVGAVPLDYMAVQYRRV